MKYHDLEDDVVTKCLCSEEQQDQGNTHRHTHPNTLSLYLQIVPATNIITGKYSTTNLDL